VHEKVIFNRTDDTMVLTYRFASSTLQTQCKDHINLQYITSRIYKHASYKVIFTMIEECDLKK